LHRFSVSVAELLNYLRKNARAEIEGGTRRSLASS